MSYKHTIHAGVENLHEIEQLLMKFSQEGKIPILELDLILQKTRNLYDVLLMLRHYQYEGMAKTDFPAPDGEPSVDALGKETLHTAAAEQASPESPKPDAVSEKPAGEKMPQVSDQTAQAGQKSMEQQEKKDQPDEKAAGGKEISARSEEKKQENAHFLSERFAGRTSLYDSIHEAVSSKGSESIGQTKPVGSIIHAIGINDRYTFIRELFKNDVKHFEHTLAVLDEASSFNDAYNYMIRNFDWDMDSEPVQSLLDIIRRKHITGRHE